MPVFDVEIIKQKPYLLKYDNTETECKSLKEIAEILDTDISTVFRIVKGKKTKIKIKPLNNTVLKIKEKKKSST